MNPYLIFSRHKYEIPNTILPKFSKEELDIAETNINWFIGNVNWIDYYIEKYLNNY